MDAYEKKWVTRLRGLKPQDRQRVKNEIARIFAIVDKTDSTTKAELSSPGKLCTVNNFVRLSPAQLAEAKNALLRAEAVHRRADREAKQIWRRVKGGEAGEP